MARKLVASLFAMLLVAGCTASAQLGTPPKPPEPVNSAPTPVPTPAPTPEVKPEPKPEPAPVKENTVKEEGGKLKFPGAIVFETGKAVLKPESEPVLEQLKEYIDKKPQITLVRIEGHTDNKGDAKMNLKLSGERAQAVKTWLTGKGIDAKRLIAVGFGDAQPVADNGTEEGRQQNRRTDFVIVEVNNKKYLKRDPIGGGTLFGENPRK